jgi:hypothetical protein
MKKFLLTTKAVSLCALSANAMHENDTEVNAKLLGKFNFEAANLRSVWLWRR